MGERWETGAEPHAMTDTFRQVRRDVVKAPDFRLGDPGVTTEDTPIELAAPLRTEALRNSLESAEIQQIYLETLVKTGRYTAAAAAAGVTRASASNYRAKYPEFEELCEEARARHWSYVEGEAERRALEGVEEPIIFQGAVVAVKRNYSDKLLVKILETHVPEYRPASSKVSVSVSATASATVAQSGPSGLSMQNLDPALMTREQRDLFERLLETMEPPRMLDVASEPHELVSAPPAASSAEGEGTPGSELVPAGEAPSR